MKFNWINVIVMAVWMILLYVRYRNITKKEKKKSFYEGLVKGREHAEKMFLANFDSTERLTGEDMLKIITILKANGYEMAYDPYKGGYDVRKQIFSDSEIQN